MTKEQKQQYLRDFNTRKINGMENLSDYPNKEVTLTKLREEILPENIEQATKEFFGEMSA